VGDRDQQADRSVRSQPKAVTAADGVSDISWSNSDTIKIYSVSYSEEHTETDRHVGEDVIDTSNYEVGSEGGWDRLEASYTSSGEYEDYVDSVTITYEVDLSGTEADLEQNTGPHQDFDDAVRIRYGLWDNNIDDFDETSVDLYRYSADWTFNSFPGGSQTTSSLTISNDDLSRSSTGIVFDAQVQGDDDPGYLSDNDNDDATVTYTRTTYVSGSNTRESYDVSISERQAQSTTGEATLAYDFDGVAAQRGAGQSNNEITISVNGNEVMSGITNYEAGRRQVSFPSSYLQAGENDVTVEGPGLSSSGGYGYTISDLSISAPTDGNFDDDSLQNWNDPYPNDPDGDGDGINDGEDAEPKIPEDYDGYQDSDGAKDEDNDGDGIPDSEDAAPNKAEDFDNYQDGDGAPDTDNDGDGIPDSEDAAPNKAEDMDGYQDGDGAPDTDNDGDGIPDSEDAAPDTPEDFDNCQDSDGAPDADGACESDRDGDGIIDSNDGAPREPEDHDGYQDNDGVPDTDNDGDGIPDSEDAAPDTSEDFDNCQDSDGAPDADGACESDADGDGIIDSNDAAPNSAEDRDGYQDSDGEPDPDNDGDGIPDSEDAAPNEAEDVDNCQDSDGAPDAEGACESDADGDGIPDSEDAAPNSAEDMDQCQDSDGAPEPDDTCESDADGDGIPDSEDAAPNSAEDMDQCQDSDGAPEPDGACATPTARLDSESLPLEAEAVQTVTGETTLEPGSEVTLRVSSDSSQAPFVKAPSTTVSPDGDIRFEVGLEAVPADVPYQLQVRHNGTVLTERSGIVEANGGTVTTTPQATPTPGQPRIEQSTARRTADRRTADRRTADRRTADPSTELDPSTSTVDRGPDIETETTAAAVGGESADDDDQEFSVGGSGPGFGVVVAVVALLAATLLSGRRS